MNKITVIILSCFGLFLMGCGADQKLERIKDMEKKGRNYKAWEKYQEFAAARPQHPRAPEAVFRAGLVSQQHFHDCFMAATFFDEVLTRYPDSEPWSRAALLQKNNCPDYFPLVAGSSWTYVDSDTLGKNARIEVQCSDLSADPKALPSQAGRFTKIYFAGAKQSFTQELYYKKEQMELQESKNALFPDSQVIIKWPIEVGTRWTARVDGRLFNYEIASLDRTVRVAAGEFDECLVVRSSAGGDLAVRNDYYAPWVGHILTSVTSKTGEKRITELASYVIPTAPEFLRTDHRP